MMTKTFRILYFGVIGLIVAVLMVGAIAGLKDGDDPLASAIAIAYMSLIFVGLPLFVAFLGLNLWGFIGHKSHRLRYGLVIILLSAWIAWSINQYLTMPLP